MALYLHTLERHHRKRFRIPMPHSEMADAIISYLRKHQDAADTIEGIAKWWIMRQRIETDMNELAKTLEALTEEGILKKRSSGRVNSLSNVVYSLNQRKKPAP